MVFCVLLAFPGRAENENPPDFPSGVRPGSPPGFDGPDEKDKEPDASTLGQWIANAGYGLAGIITFFSVRRLPSATVQSWNAGRDIGRLEALRKEADRLKQWGEKLEKAFPDAMGRLERATQTYQKTLEGLNGSLAQLSGDGTWEGKSQEMDRHLDGLLALPLMNGREKLRGELTTLIGAWKTNRNPQPLEEWIASHRDYDLIRTAKGAAWLTGYRGLQRELSGMAWKERGSTAELERWIRSPVSERGAENSGWTEWVKTFRELSSAERKAAALFAKESNAEARVIFGKQIRPTVSLSPVAIREPGQFLFHHADESGELDSEGVLTQMKGTCRRELAAVGANAKQAAKAASPFRQLGRFVWPVAPAAAGTAVGGYYSVEGVRYWLGGKEATSVPSGERK